MQVDKPVCPLYMGDLMQVDKPVCPLYMGDLMQVDKPVCPLYMGDLDAGGQTSLFCLFTNY